MTLNEPTDPHPATSLPPASATVPAFPASAPAVAADENTTPTLNAAPHDTPEHTDEAAAITLAQTAEGPEASNPSAEGTPPPSPAITPDTDPFPETEDKREDSSAETAAEGGRGARVEQSVPVNHGTVIGVQNNSEIQRLRGTPLPAEWIDSRLRCYLANDQTTQAIDTILAAHRVAVIHARAGTGRYTTALHVLTSQDVKTIRQVRREPNDKVELEGLKDDDTGWILDLRDEAEVLPTSFGLHLREVTDHLRETSSFLAVITHTDNWTRVADEAPDLAHHLNPPDALHVLRAHLDAQQTPVDQLDRWLGEGKITQHLEGATPAQAVRWAEKINTAVKLNHSTEERKDFQDLVESVVQSVQNWRAKLLDWHSKNTDSGHRTYLLAAAVLDGASAGTVYEAHTELGTALGDTPEPTKGQQGPGIIQLTHAIGAELGSDNRIRFVKPGYAEATVDYFWVDRPHHVEAFTRWTADQAAALPSELGTPLANRVSQWVTRYTLTKQNLTVLRAIATHWTNSRDFRHHAQDLLVAAAIDPVTGRLARTRYLAWAKAPDTTDATKSKHTPVALKQALAGALAQLGPAYPNIALKRLAEIAANTTEPRVTDAVGDALMELWDQEGLQETIRTTLTSWFDATQPHYTAAARRAFLHLAARAVPNGIPILLTADNTEPDTWTLTGWRCALDGTTTAVQAAVDTWLDAALAHPGLRTAVIETFTEAILRSHADRTYLPQRYILLNHAANGWEPAHAGQQPTERTHLRDELLIALREADPNAPTRPHAAPTTP
ncbi:hypothetical protein [Streptomyces sp. NPDC020965]|uniref:hypothetical protein n=1 Tax=Streptomyces sp. NPDC020965 TaxID=3365105 RepID=UPI00379C6643